MAVNQTESIRLEQRSLIKCLAVEKCKPCKINSRICNIYISTPWSVSWKENVLCRADSKEGQADSLRT